ncbi:MAG: hypothetical protein ACP5JH_10495 [Bacteroidota bacterium]
MDFITYSSLFRSVGNCQPEFLPDSSFFHLSPKINFAGKPAVTGYLTFGVDILAPGLNLMKELALTNYRIPLPGQRLCVRALIPPYLKQYPLREGITRRLSSAPWLMVKALAPKAVVRGDNIRTIKNVRFLFFLLFRRYSILIP